MKHPLLSPVLKTPRESDPHAAADAPCALGRICCDAGQGRRRAPVKAKTPAATAAQVSMRIGVRISSGEAKPSTILPGVRAGDLAVVGFVAMTDSLDLHSACARWGET